MNPYERIAEAYIDKDAEVKRLFAPPPQPPIETPFADYYKEKKEKEIDWEKMLETWVTKPFEQLETVAGAAITAPFRPRPKGTELLSEAMLSPLSYLPPTKETELLSKVAGLQYETYRKWKEEGKDPSIPIGIPNWKQLGAWLKPILKKDIVLKKLGVDVESWEEPTEYEMARMGMAETAEFTPWIFLMAGRGAKTALEKAANIATAQMKKGKPAEEALNIAFNKLAKKGQMPKFAPPKAEAPEVPLAPKPEVPRPPVTPEVPPEAPRAIIEPIKPPVGVLSPELEALSDTPIGKMSPDIVEAFGIRETVGKIRTFNKKVLPLEYRTQLDEITKAFDLKFRTPKTIDRRQQLLAHLEKIKVEGGEIDVPLEYIEMASKVSLKDLTPNQLNQIYGEASAIAQQGLLKNKLIKVQAKRRVKNAVEELVTQLGEPPKRPAVITAEALKRDFPTAAKEKAQSFFTRTYRQERVLRDLDGYADGPLTNTIYRPVNEAKDEFLFERIGGNESLKKVIKDNNIDFAKMISAKQKFSGGVTLTSEEKIGVYLSSRNPDNLLHLKYGNKFSDDLIKEITDSLTPEEKILANFLSKHFNDPVKFAELSRVRTLVEGKPLLPAKDYFPIRLEWKADPEFNAANLIAKEEIYRYTAKYASSGIPKGFIRERTHKAIQAVNLKAFEIFDENLVLTSHYKAFAPVVRDLQLIIKDPKFMASYKARVGDSGYAVLSRWLKQVAEADPLRAANFGEKMCRLFRTNAVTSVLGFNITTSLKQFPSFFGGMAEAGVVPVMRGLTTFLRHPKETMALIKELCPQLHVRTIERELAEAKASRSIAKRVMGKMTKKEVFMLLTTTMDRLVVNSIWRGAFDNGLSKGLSRKEAAKTAEAIIRRTQPFFDVKDLPEFWRSGELMKALTMFTNQLNNYFNYYKFDIFGARMAGKIGNVEALKKTILAFVLPALTIGAVTRSELPKDAEDVSRDLAGMGLATVPVFGNWMSAAVRGWRSSGIITTEILKAIGDLTYWASEGNLGKAALQIPELAALATGVPYAQPKRTVEAMVELAQKKSDDWLSLIWGKYTREKARKLPLKKLEGQWADDFEEYEAIEDIKIGKVTKSATTQRTEYRKAHPDIDAKYFITGRFTTLKTNRAKQIAMSLIKEHNLDPELIRGYENVFGEGAEPIEEVGGLSGRLWGNVRPSLDSGTLGGLNRLWYGGGNLTEGEKSRLWKVHQANPMGQPVFNTWAKQTLRQSFENSVLGR